MFRVSLPAAGNPRRRGKSLKNVCGVLRVSLGADSHPLEANPGFSEVGGGAQTRSVGCSHGIPNFSWSPGNSVIVHKQSQGAVKSQLGWGKRRGSDNSRGERGDGTAGIPIGNGNAGISSPPGCCSGFGAQPAPKSRGSIPLFPRGWTPESNCATRTES